MTLSDALDLIVARTGHERYRWLCSEANPDAEQREGYRRVVMEQAGLRPATPYPPRWRQAASAALALVRWALDGFGLATRRRRAQRLAICRACPHHDAAADRCRRCGCFLSLKAAVAGQACPEGKW